MAVLSRGRGWPRQSRSQLETLHWEIVMAHEVTLVLGDGVGPELADAARRCVDATGVEINWDEQEAGIDVMDRTGTPLPDALMETYDWYKQNMDAIGLKRA